MGYVARYRAEAQEKKLPNFNRLVIAQLRSDTDQAIVALHGWSTPMWFAPELPLIFPNYQEAFSWVEHKLKSLCQ